MCFKFCLYVSLFMTLITIIWINYDASNSYEFWTDIN